MGNQNAISAETSRRLDELYLELQRAKVMRLQLLEIQTNKTINLLLRRLGLRRNDYERNLVGE